MSQDTQEKNDEIDALEAIFPNEIFRLDPDTIEVRVHADLQVRILFPETYPSRSAPHYELHGKLVNGSKFDDLSRQLDEMAQESLGEVVVFKWIEFLRTWCETLCQSDLTSSAKNPTNSVDNENPLPDEEEQEIVDFDEILNDHLVATEELSKRKSNSWQSKIVSGDSFVDRKSVFQAHLAPVGSPAEVVEMLAELKSNNKVARATHNIMAYRLLSPQGREQGDCDDDGETAAGGRLLHLLHVVGAANVCVVVSRWYGGVQLGADRFKHINNAARALLDRQGYIAPDPRRRR